MMRGAKPRLVVDNEAVSAVPKAPTWFSREAAAEWRRIMPSLVQRRILTVADLGSVENYCVAQGRVRQLEQALAAGFDPAMPSARC